MSNKAYFYVLRTLRHLQSCDSTVGTRIPIYTKRTYGSKACLLKHVTQHVNKHTPATTSSLSFRFLSQETPGSVEEKNEKTELHPQPSKNVPDSSVNNVHIQVKEKIDINVVNPLANDESFGMQGVPSKVRDERYPEIYDALKKCNSPSDVLELCSSPSMSLKLVSNCFTTMWETVKKIGVEQRRYEKQLMFEHPNFENLCRHAMHGANRMSSEDLVYTLHAVVKLQVHHRTRLVQTLLRACQEHLNDFEEREISILATSLDGMDSSRNVDALRSGLRLLVEVRMPEIRGVLPLQTMMRSIGKDAPVSLKKKLERKALEMVDEFSLPNAQYMFTTLAAIQMRSIPLLDACSQKIIDNLDGLPFWKLINVLQACRELSYRNEELLSAVGDYVVSTIYMWHTKQVTLLLSVLENLGFRHVSLLDIFADKVIQNPQSLTLKDLLITVKIYSLLNHLPEGRSQQFLEALNTSLALYLPRIPPVELLRVMFSFCILGYFPQIPLDKLLQEDVLNELLTSANHNVEINERMLHGINLCLELDKPSHTKRQVVAQGKPSAVNVTTQPDVQVTLQSILGDSNLLQHNVQLPNDYYIDFVLALDTEQNKVVTVADTQASDNALHIKRVAVLCAPVSSFALGTSHPLGKLAMKMRHLKALGYHVVLVPVNEFGKLNELERVEFLRSRIFPEKAPVPAEEDITDTSGTEQSIHSGH
ncbi:FAST kinase domain-containing protein 2, mitochondrial [Rhinophrynus dorsalis]